MGLSERSFSRNCRCLRRELLLGDKRDGLVAFASPSPGGVGTRDQNKGEKKNPGTNQSRAVHTTLQECRLGSETQALSQRATGFQDSVWSQITRKAAVMGIPRISPMPPHTQPQNNSEMVMATALSCTCRPTS